MFRVEINNVAYIAYTCEYNIEALTVQLINRLIFLQTILKQPFLKNPQQFKPFRQAHVQFSVAYYENQRRTSLCVL